MARLQALEVSGVPVIRVLIAPLAFAADLVIRYALVQHSCSTGHRFLLHAIAVLAFLVTLAGAVLSYRHYQQTRDANEEGDTPLDHEKFLALAGALSSLAFAVVIVANSVPEIMLSPCD